MRSIRYVTAFVLVGMVGCGGGDSSGPEQVGSVLIQPGQATLESIDATVTLTAEVRNTGGAAMTGATVSWSSADNGIATVDGTGKVTARANGTARIVATSSQVADTAIVTVAQRAVTLNVTPLRDTLDAGDFVQLNAAAVDANGHAVAGASLTWISSDTTIATVNAQGRVSARFRGEARITVRIGTIETSATITVTIADLRPTSNLTIGGTQVYGRLEIPAGVTVTVSSALNVRVLDSLRISGTLKGDCVDIRVTVEGPMRIIGGTVDNVCSNPNSPAAPIVMLNDDTWVIDSGATIQGGPVIISNGPTPPASVQYALVEFQLFPGSSHPCRFAGSTLNLNRPPRHGSNGSPKGQDGANGYPAWEACSGELTVSGLQYTGADGGNGGDGTATATAGGVGGWGGRGGYVTMNSETKVRFTSEAGTSVFRPGSGGAGGKAKGGPDTRPEALGGNGGAPGQFASSAPVIAIEPGAVNIIYSFKDVRGGDAEVNAPNGADATASTPAQPGVAGVARGGNAGEPSLTVNVIGNQLGMFNAFQSLTGIEYAVITHETMTDGINGGRGMVIGGRGGNGSRQFKSGGVGPAHQAVGGNGANVRLIDNRAGGPTGIGIPGNGGHSVVQQTFGGEGWRDCVAGSIESGGIGGAGGVPVMSSGAPGSGPGGLLGNVGQVLLHNASNGGSGGDGEQRGDGGAGGSVTVVLGVVDSQGSLNPGQPGKPCNYTATAKATVANDPSGHEPFLFVTQLTQGTVKLQPNNGIEVSIGIKMTGAMTQLPNGSFTFAATGSGTINGRTAAGTFTNGVVTVDANGRIATVTGTFTFGTNGGLPGGQPVSYNVNLTAPVQTP